MKVEQLHWMPERIDIGVVHGTRSGCTSAQTESSRRSNPTLLQTRMAATSHPNGKARQMTAVPTL